MHRQRLERKLSGSKVLRSGFAFIRAAAQGAAVMSHSGRRCVSALTDPGRPLVNTSGAPLRTIRGVEDADKKKSTMRTKCSLERLQDPVTENTANASKCPGVGHTIPPFRRDGNRWNKRKAKTKNNNKKKTPAVTPAHDVTDCVWPRRHGDGTNKHEAAGSPSEPDLRPSNQVTD